MLIRGSSENTFCINGLVNRTEACVTSWKNPRTIEKLQASVLYRRNRISQYPCFELMTTSVFLYIPVPHSFLFDCPVLFSNVCSLKCRSCMSFSSGHAICWNLMVYAPWLQGESWSTSVAVSKHLFFVALL